jgi:uncharacterized protein
VGFGARENIVFANASGHAGKGKRGDDIVCAAVTVLLRTTMTVLSGQGKSPVLEAVATERGMLAFRVSAFSEADVPLLRYATVFLREGITSLAREYPDAVSVLFEEVADRVSSGPVSGLA